MVRKSTMFSNAKVDVTICHHLPVFSHSLVVRTSGIRGSAECVTDALTTFLRLLWSSTVYTCGDMEPTLFFRIMRGKKLLILTVSMRLSSKRSLYLIETN